MTIEGWKVTRSDTGGFTFEPPKTNPKFQNNVHGNVGTFMQASDIGHLDLR
ncbi:hypothetical protein [Glycomyces salinus]|uniref:hypothetical protein n=1 Tax=Glycomyces salinus TaxID=980294 RepID=UPI0018ED5697|nr:hypothetical protein [Glycomyces salinus]